MTFDHRQTPLGPLVDEYLAWKGGEQGRSAKTIQSYGWHLTRRMCVALPAKHARQVTKADMRSVLSLYNTPSRGVATSVFNDFWRWCKNEGYVRDTPMEGIDAPRRRQHHVYDVFTEAEEAALVTLGPDTRFGLPIAVRDKTCALILLRAGLRIGELRNLKVKDVDLSERWLIVRRGKGDKPRVVPIRGELVRALEQFMLTEIPRQDRTPQPMDHVLYGARVTGSSAKVQRGEIVLATTPLTPVAESTGWRWWAACCKRAGVEHRKPHMARHTYATKLLRATHDLEAVGKALGHASLASTEVYLHAEVSHVGDAVQRLEDAREQMAADELAARTRHFENDPAERNA